MSGSTEVPVLCGAPSHPFGLPLLLFLAVAWSNFDRFMGRAVLCLVCHSE